MKLDDVTAVVCMGLPLSHEHQASLAIKLPTLFVIGQLHCPMTRLEAILKTTHHNTGLVMVGGADEKLTLSEPFKRQHHVTQSMADVLIAVSVINIFLCTPHRNSILTKSSSFSAPGERLYIPRDGDRQHPMMIIFFVNFLFYRIKKNFFITANFLI